MAKPRITKAILSLSSILILILAAIAYFAVPMPEPGITFSGPETSGGQLTQAAESTTSPISEESERNPAGSADSERLESNEILQCDEANLLTTVDVDSTALRAQLENKLTNPSSNLGTNYEVMGILISTRNAPETRLQQLGELYKLEPDNNFVIRNLLSACVSTPSAPVCRDFAANPAIVDSDGFSLSQLTAIEIANENFNSVKALLTKAASTENYDDMSSELISYQLIGTEDLSREQLPFLHLEIILNASQFDSAHLPLIIDFCRVNAEQDPEVASACLGLGRLVEQNSESIMQTLIGFSLQEETHMAVGNTDAYIETEVRELGFSNSASGRASRQAQELATHDRRLYQSWFSTLLESGEPYAAQQLISEARQLSSDPAYYPCKNSF